MYYFYRTLHFVALVMSRLAMRLGPPGLLWAASGSLEEWSDAGMWRARPSVRRSKLADYCEARFIRAYARKDGAATATWARLEYMALQRH